MNNTIKIRKGCKDNFNAYMVKNAKFEDGYDIPICPSTTTEFPKKIITFLEAKEELKKNNPDLDSVVCFFKDDYKFDSKKNGIWNNPYSWLKLLSKFSGVIQPDFSTNQDFPFPIKLHNLYRMRAIGCFLVDNGIPVIANYRSGTNETFDYCTAGIEKNSFVCISTHGCIRNNKDKKRLCEGLEQLIIKKSPIGIIVYGKIPKEMKYILEKNKIPYRSYLTDLDRRLGAKYE